MSDIAMSFLLACILMIHTGCRSEIIIKVCEKNEKRIVCAKCFSSGNSTKLNFLLIIRSGRLMVIISVPPKSMENVA